MSALAQALAAHDVIYSSPPSSSSSSSSSPLPSMSSSVSSSTSLPALTTSSSSSSSSISFPGPPPLKLVVNVTNEHLAVLLPKHLWKSDSVASMCDNFYCRVRFSLFERRHHCRKCGGVFCHACSSRTAGLLDTANLDFLHPPRNVPLTAFESPDSPILESRVCDGCFDQLRGCPTTPRTPDLIRPSLSRAFTSPISVLKRPLTAPTSGDSSPDSSVATPPNGSSLLPPSPRKTRSLRTATSNSSLNSASATRRPLRISHLPLPPDLGVERSYGELDAYPLRRSSILCKATGGGRWEPKQSPVLVGYRVPVPGGKAPFEIEMEREEAEERKRRSNPVVKDGDFQYRFNQPAQPIIPYSGFQTISTF